MKTKIRTPKRWRRFRINECEKNSNGEVIDSLGNILLYSACRDYRENIGGDCWINISKNNKGFIVWGDMEGDLFESIFKTEIKAVNFAIKKMEEYK